MSATADFLVAHRITKSFDGTRVLDEVSVKISKGEVTAIVGPSGSGKSTLLRCFNFLEVPDSGVVILDGALIGYGVKDGQRYRLDDAALCRQRQKIGMVFQQFHLFPHLTATENIMLALRRTQGMSRSDATDKAQSLLDAMGLNHRRDAYPKELSGGQQQRVAIARSLALSPSVMLFDEPTSALDPEYVNEVRDAMRKVAQAGMTMVLVSHDIKFAREVASRALFIDAGQIVESGPSEQVLRQPTSLRAQAFLANAN
ncbi:amino acid ABC transporter ATP-binding protein [soil metagenome]